MNTSFSPLQSTLMSLVFFDYFQTSPTLSVRTVISLSGGHKIPSLLVTCATNRTKIAKLWSDTRTMNVARSHIFNVLTARIAQNIIALWKRIWPSDTRKADLLWGRIFDMAPTLFLSIRVEYFRRWTKYSGFF